MAGNSIRDATGADGPALAHLVHHLAAGEAPERVAARLRVVLSCPGHHLFVAEDSGTVVGFLHGFRRPALEKGVDFVIQAMAVSPERHGGGIGTALLRHAEALARTLGCDAITLHSREDRGLAHAFYESRGYGAVARSVLFRKPTG